MEVVVHLKHQIREAIGYGAIKMNIDTDLQWAFWMAF
jgi:fructose-bisphosphate aldolase class II